MQILPHQVKLVVYALDLARAIARRDKQYSAQLLITLTRRKLILEVFVLLVSAWTMTTSLATAQSWPLSQATPLPQAKSELAPLATSPSLPQAYSCMPTTGPNPSWEHCRERKIDEELRRARAASRPIVELSDAVGKALRPDQVANMGRKLADQMLGSPAIQSGWMEKFGNFLNGKNLNASEIADKIYSNSNTRSFIGQQLDLEENCQLAKMCDVIKRAR